MDFPSRPQEKKKDGKKVEGDTFKSLVISVFPKKYILLIFNVLKKSKM